MMQVFEKMTQYKLE